MRKTTRDKARGEVLKTSGIILILALGLACGPPTPRTGAAARSTIEDIFQARLPSSAAKPKTLGRAFMTLIVVGTFECSPEDLQKFLTASALLPDDLEDGTNPLEGYSTHNTPWWQPASLENPSGIECDWDTGTDVASCKFAAGHNAGSDLITVYFNVVYENKNQAGSHRPAVKSDPDWQLKAESAASPGP